MKTLITGASGVIGSSVVRELLKDGQEVRALLRKGGDRRTLKGLDLQIADGDIMEPEAVDQAMKGCDQVYHLAAQYVHWHPNGADFVRRVNIEGSRIVLEAAKKHSASRIVFTSSISSLGFHKDRPSTEEDCPSENEIQRSPYRESKWKSEQLAWDMIRKENMPIVIVNPASPIGVRDYKPTPTGRTILDFLNGKMFAYVDAGLNVIDVEDMAVGFLMAGKKGRIGERYVLGNHNTTLRDFLYGLAELTGLPAPKVKVPKVVVRVMAEVAEKIADLTKKPPIAAIEQAMHLDYNEYVDCSKAARELGLPQNDIRIAMRKAVKYYVDEGYVNPARVKMIKMG